MIASNVFIVWIVIRIMFTRIAGRSIGSVTYSNRCSEEAPSTSAAS